MERALRLKLRRQAKRAQRREIGKTLRAATFARRRKHATPVG